MAMSKIVCTWTGLTGLPGYSIFYTESAQMAPAPFGTFWGAIAAYLPAPLHVIVPNSGEVIDETTGKMTGVWSTGTQVDTTATGGLNYIPASGAQVKWYTPAFANGRRVIGRTYIVPLTAAQYGTSGGLISATVSNAIAAAAETLRSSLGGQLLVWTRPKYKVTTPGDPPVLVTPGRKTAVNSVVCPTKSVVLRSRRDT